MKTTIKNLINQVKKALTTRSSLPENISNSAYADNHGNLISRDMPDSNTDIIVFIGGIVEDMTKCEKLYNKDALTLAAETVTPAETTPTTEANQEAPTEAPAADPADNKEFLKVPECLGHGFTPAEKEALKRINDRQNASGRFENITRDDLRIEAEK